MRYCPNCGAMLPQLLPSGIHMNPSSEGERAADAAGQGLFEKGQTDIAEQRDVDVSVRSNPIDAPASPPELSDEDIDAILASDDIYYLIDDAEAPVRLSDPAPVRADEGGSAMMGDSSIPMGGAIAGEVPRRQPPRSRWRRKSVIVPALIAVLLGALILALTFQGVINVNDGSKTSSNVYTTKFTYAWQFENANFTVSLNISKQEFEQYADQSIARGVSSPSEYDYVKNFITLNDSTMIELASMLKGIANESGMSSHELLSLTLSFVQTIPYSTDAANYGVDEYWAYPVEVLYHDAGDCEDKSFLYATLVEEMGFDAVILIYSDHVAVGVNDTGVTGTYYLHDGVKYYYCETTEVGWQIGDRLPAGYNSAYVVDV